MLWLEGERDGGEQSLQHWQVFWPLPSEYSLFHMLQNGDFVSEEQFGFQTIVSKEAKQSFFEITFALEGAVKGMVRVFPDIVCL